MTEMCDRCPRTPVTHVPSLYRSQPGHPATTTMSLARPTTWSKRLPGTTDDFDDAWRDPRCRGRARPMTTENGTPPNARSGDSPATTPPGPEPYDAQ